MKPTLDMPFDRDDHWALEGRPCPVAPTAEMMRRLSETHPRARLDVGADMFLPEGQRLARLVTISPPNPEELARAPLLEGWSLYYMGERMGWRAVGKLMGTDDGLTFYVRGRVTSPTIREVDAERRWVRVNGAIYRLGEPL